MNLFKYCLYIFLMSVNKNFAKARNVYENPHYSERENFEQINSPYSKRKTFREEYARESNDDLNNDLSDPMGNAGFDQLRSHQYEPSEMYYQQVPNRMSKLNSDNMYDVKKREYFADMKTGRDGQFQVVLDPKSKKAVAVIDNPESQNYDMQGWRNQRDYELNQGNYDNDVYSQGNQEQVVVYPVNQYDRMMGRGNMEYAGVDNLQSSNQNLRNAPEYNQGQLVYRNMGNKDNSMKIKRHISDKDNKRNINNQKFQNVDLKQNKFDQKENNEKLNNIKRSIPNWSKDQIQALKTSLSAFQENNAEYDNLKNIMSNMGLQETYNKKQRDIKSNDEDENLNNNDIAMRQNVKRWEDKKPTDETIKRDVINEKNNDATEFNNKQTKRKSEQPSKLNLSTDNKNDEPDRKRRDNEMENSNLMKASEKSGEVSQNKAAVAQDEKISMDDKDLQKRRISEDEDYDQKIESEIQAKIDAIKEKVKREILLEKQKRQNARTKRSTSLLDSENKNINPELTYDSMKPHIRTRRNTNETSDKEQLSEKKEYNITKNKQFYTERNTEESNSNTKLQLNDSKNDETSRENTLFDPENSEKYDKISNNSNSAPHKRTRREINNKETIIEEKTKEENKLLDNNKITKKQNKQSDQTFERNEGDKINLQTKREINDVQDTSYKERTKYSRSKRANNYLPENKLIFRPYLSQDEEEENENGEFNNMYDQQYIEKRDAFEPDYQYFEKEDNSQEFQAQEKSPGYMEALHPVRRQNHLHSSYLEDAGNYEQSPAFYSKNLQREYRSRITNRDKRENGKSQAHNAGISRKLSNDKSKRVNNVENRKESSESENEFFGALPQNYQEGELNRYKRIKRNIYDKKLPNQT